MAAGFPSWADFQLTPEFSSDTMMYVAQGYIHRYTVGIELIYQLALDIARRMFY